MCGTLVLFLFLDQMTCGGACFFVFDRCTLYAGIAVGWCIQIIVLLI